MGTSKAYGTPKWPGVNSAVGEAVSSGGQQDDVLDALGKFSEGYQNHLGFGSGTGIGGRGISERGGTGSGGGSGGRGTTSGGSVSRVRAAKSGARLASFLSTAQRSGFNEALRQFDLTHLSNKPLDEVLDSLTDILSEGGGLLDDDSLTRAMALTLDELTDDIETQNELEDLFSQDNIDLESTLQTYYANVLALNFEQKEYSYVREKYSRIETRDFFKQARGIIQAIVRDELSQERTLSSIDWNSSEGQRIADEINNEVLEILIP